MKCGDHLPNCKTNITTHILFFRDFFGEESLLDTNRSQMVHCNIAILKDKRWDKLVSEAMRIL